MHHYERSWSQDGLGRRCGGSEDDCAGDVSVRDRSGFDFPNCSHQFIIDREMQYHGSVLEDERLGEVGAGRVVLAFDQSVSNAASEQFTDALRGAI